LVVKNHAHSYLKFILAVFNNMLLYGPYRIANVYQLMISKLYQTVNCKAIALH